MARRRRRTPGLEVRLDRRVQLVGEQGRDRDGDHDALQGDRRVFQRGERKPTTSGL
jgi:hypothetical protein